MTVAAPTFSTEDVKALARAILDGWQDRNGRDMECCRHCGNEFGWYDRNGKYVEPETVVHALDCPVIVAKDVLTGLK